MIVPFGRREVSEDVVDLLFECHGRIRRFLAMAMALEDAGGQEPGQIVAAVRRYFTEAFPLHVEDEEVDIAPHLPADVAAKVRADHTCHAAAVAELLASPPHELPAAARRLAAELEPHLAFEEALVFPAIRALAAPARDAIRGAMRARRERQLTAHGVRDPR